MKTAVFSTKPYDRGFLDAANRKYSKEITYFEPRLTAETALMAKGFETVCAFVHDDLKSHVLNLIHEGGTRHIVMRCAGYNNVDLKTVQALGMRVGRVPAYSPHAVAEHAVGLILDLNRRIHRSFFRVREGNFALEGLLGFDLFGKTAGVIGTGKIGLVMIQILRGFGCQVLAYDPYPTPECGKRGGEYVPLEELFRRSDIVTLHCPLTPQTHHLVNGNAISQMKDGVMLINTSRGGILDTVAVIQGLKDGKIGYLGLDVYEEEDNLFFEDLSNAIIQDDVFSRLLTFPNVLVTAHQGFFTAEALKAIGETTLANIDDFEKGRPCPNEIASK
ncbi:MAG TPA: 2-hydroxyacid dehydrogenase [bacterium]|nr:2-hydroxyacid dehydrogenase [bacterium]